MFRDGLRCGLARRRVVGALEPGVLEPFDVDRQRRLALVLAHRRLDPVSLPDERERVEVARERRADERGEFLYRYVSKGTYKGGKDSGDLLDDGTLYAAKFNDE